VNLTELLDWSEVTAPFQVAWSLGVEEKFYLTWPALAFGALRRHRPIVLGVAMGLIAAAVLFAPNSPAARLIAPYFPILVGCGLAMQLASGVGFRSLERLTKSTWTVAAAGLAVLIPWGTPTDQGVTLLIYSVLIGFVLGGVVARHDLAVDRWRPVTWLGERSYAIYLFHVLVFRFVRVATDGALSGNALELAVLLVGGAFTALLADALRRVVELPMIRRGRSVAARHSPEVQTI
jgi:peptidoglycan/LPS O-acetylase OafA/YrhL